jgi:phage tail tube protein FII
MSTPEIQHWNATLLDVNNAPINLKGIVTELTAPTLERDFDTDKRSGEIGVVPRPKFFNEVEVSFTVRRVFPAFSKALLEAVNKPLTLQCNTIIENSDGSNNMYSWFIRGYHSSIPLGDLSADGMEAEVSLMAHYLSLTFGTLTLVYDPVNYVYSINGVNLFADIKSNLAL